MRLSPSWLLLPYHPLQTTPLTSPNMPSSSRPQPAPPHAPDPQTTSSRMTTFQAKAVAALKNPPIFPEPEPSYDGWQPPTSDDPNVELMTFTASTFEGFIAEMVGEEERSASPRGRRRGGREAATRQAAEDEAQNKFSIQSEGVESYGPEFWPRLRSARRVSVSAGRAGIKEQSREAPSLTLVPLLPTQLNIKRQLEAKIDFSPWPPRWDDIVTEMHLTQMRHLLEDLSFIVERAKCEKKQMKQVLPPVDWTFKALNVLVKVLRKYQGTAPSTICPKFKALSLATEAFETLQREILEGGVTGEVQQQGGDAGSSSGQRHRGKKGGPRNPKPKKGSKGAKKGDKK